MLWLLLLLIGPAAAGPTALEQLAPTQNELEAALESAEGAATRAEALGEASLLLQNALADARAESKKLAVCEDPDITSLVARARTFGAAWRDAAQRLRVESDRLGRMARRGTAKIEPGRLRALEGRASAQAADVALASAWHGTFLETAFEECSPELTPTSGLPRALRAEGEVDGPVAVVIRGGGFLCPEMVPADGRVVVVEPMGCLSRSACSCPLLPLLPAAVLDQSD